MRGLRAIRNNIQSYWRRFVEWHRRWEDGLAEICEKCPMENRDVMWCPIAEQHPRVAKCFEEELKEKPKKKCYGSPWPRSISERDHRSEI